MVGYGSHKLANLGQRCYVLLALISRVCIKLFYITLSVYMVYLHVR